MQEIFIQGKARTELAIILHGLGCSPEAMEGVTDAVKDGRPDADILVLSMPFAGRFGAFAIGPAADIAAGVVQRIEAAIENCASYERIVLAGHSFGAVIARKVAIIAHGELPDAKFEPELADHCKRRPWADQIERIVMLGGMNRGWLPAAARNWVVATFWTMGSWWAELLSLFTFGVARLTIAGIRQGAPFIVQTRLQWLALTRAKQASGERQILVIQLLGGSDDLVAPDDSVDFACDMQGSFQGSLEPSFALIEIPFGSHEDVYQMRKPSDGDMDLIVGAVNAGTLSHVTKHSNLIAQTKWYLFNRAVSQALPALSDIHIDPAHMQDMPALHLDTEATDVVFVIHGIRDRGFWTQKIARVIKQQAAQWNAGHPNEKPRHFRSFTGSYGYFAMAPFVLPWIRRWKVEWLMDHYVEARARHPNAAISYVGHSNGSYLLARALKDYPAARFEKVVLAGSVIRRDFDWAQRLTRQPGASAPQVRELLNYVATHDWVVAIFSKAFQCVRPFDLGSAGHDGFKQFRSRNRHPNLHESRFVVGSHSAALVESQWDDIAGFVIQGGPVPGLPDRDFQRRRSRTLIATSWLAPLLLLLILWTVLGIGVALAKSVFGDGVLQLHQPWWHWKGLECASLIVVPDVCRFAAPVGEGMLAVFNWFAAFLQGQISVPWHAPADGGADPWLYLRAAACGFYWWAVYIVASRF